MAHHREALRLVAIAVVVTAFVRASPAQAHGSVSERLAALERAIAARPNDPALYDQRGALHLLAENYTQAAEDLRVALEADPDRPGTAHRLAEALFELGDDAEAIEIATRALADDPSSTSTRLVRARALAGVGEVAAAERDFDRALAESAAPSPEIYRERAQLLAGAGRVDQAVAGLRQGLDKLGPLVTLVELAADLEERRGERGAALALLDRLPERLASSPRWLVRRGGLLEASGQPAAAQDAYRRALTALAQLPPGRADAPAFAATRALAEEGRRRLAAAIEVPARPRPDYRALALAISTVLLFIGWLVYAVRQRPKPARPE